MTIRSLHVIVGLSILGASSDSWGGKGEQGAGSQGFSIQGFSIQGFSIQGQNPQGFSIQGESSQGFSIQGVSPQGFSIQGFSIQGANEQGFSIQGFSIQGFSIQGLNDQGFSIQGLNVAGRGIDRLRGLVAPLQLQNIELVALPSHTLQGIQPGSSIVYQAGPSGARLQAGPGTAVSATNAGNFIHVPGLPSSQSALQGTLWNMVFKDGAGAEGRIPLFIADIEKDRGTNSSTSPSNEDIYLYTVYYRQPATGQWSSLCPADSNGKAQAMAVPIDPTDWTSEASRTRFAFACTASGVAAKCARNWGYKPWVTGLKPFYDTCLIAARADYCQDGQSYTRDGTMVDLYDFIPTAGGANAINGTVGFSVDPFARKPMLHEEYQVSLDGRVLDVFAPWEIDPAVRAQVPGIDQLRLSGLRSSRYPDLNPGRSCPAAPYVIGRCDPGAPFSCRRADAPVPFPFGPFIGVSSASHCGHHEDEPGEPLDPGCSACTSRICAVDPTCCGNPDGNAFPGSLVWDGRCQALRQQVCRSTAEGTTTEHLWPLGVVARGRVDRPSTVLRGAMGSFEGFVTEGDVQFAEGWACDPDFPVTSSPVQISVGGALGASGTTLLTATADLPLIPGWNDIVASECGGGARHGFRVALPAGSAGREVYVYGIDLNVPGAPFSLLRGGNKTAPVPGGPPPPSPRAAIFTGWLEPPASDAYRFAVEAGPADKFRLWINGRYVAGNWKDPVTTPPTPGAFTLDPPPPPTLFLQAGIRYAVRLEYLRPDASPTGSSRLMVTWVRPQVSPLPPPQPIPTAALYAMAQSNGNGLQGTYFPGATSLATLPANSASTVPRTFGSVDHVWSDRNSPITGRNGPPLPGLSVADTFGARFEGQIVPPVSGDYSFYLDTDGAAHVFVNGQQVATASRIGASRELCAHDICLTGGPLTAACEQNNFCAAMVCAADVECCSQTWDARCVQEVTTFCEQDVCNPAQAAAVTLHAGWKYDIRVEYQHRGAEPGDPVRGATLKLLWSLPGHAREVIPAARLLAATGAPAAQTGSGINAAYFSDAELKEEYLDLVAPNLGFEPGSPPSAARPSSLTCGGPGAPACGPAPAPGAPALTAATMGEPDGDQSGMSVTLAGGGAAAGAFLTVFERRPDGTLFAVGSPSLTTTGAALFTTAPIWLSRGTHVLHATQAVDGQTSPLSAPLVVEVTDPEAAPPPLVGQPTVSGTGTTGVVAIGGSAAPNAGVNVTIHPKGTTGTIAAATLGADAGGSWTGDFTLPPGSYEITSTQTSNGHTSDATTTSVEVPVPPLVVIAPPDGHSIACDTPACLVTVSGSGASPAFGPILVADGDGSLFVDLPTHPQPLVANLDGTFSGQVALDHGRHQLKIFQRTNGLAGDAAPRILVVRPTLGGITVHSPANDEVSGNRITVAGMGPPRQGLRGQVTVYQVPRVGTACPTVASAEAATKLGEARLADDGSFALPVEISGVGRQCLALSYTARSLSGAGTADSVLAPSIAVRVRPSPPRITKPERTGTLQASSLGVAVEGTALADASVTVYAERAFAGSVSAPPTPSNGTFATTFWLPAAGTYRLTATATIDGAESLRSEPPVIVSIGDVTPPTLKVADPADPTRKPVREISVTAPNDGGVDFDVGPWVTAIDPSPTGGPGTPLDPSRIVCQPASGTAVHFPIAATKVTCTARDAADNVGSTSFAVVVRVNEVPFLSGSNLVAEAQSPSGEPVHYQITAAGLLADCWGGLFGCGHSLPVGTGLGRVPTALATDPVTGELYAALGGYNRAIYLFKSTDAGATWQLLPDTGGYTISRILVQSGSPSTLYLMADTSSSDPFDMGLRISRNGGQSWQRTLTFVPVAGVAQDPSDGAHLLVWNQTAGGVRPSRLYETRDGGATWQDASAGLPDAQIDAVAIDPEDDNRMYLSLQSVGGGDGRRIRIFRRTGTEWSERPIFPFATIFQHSAKQIFVAPVTAPCATGDPFPAVFAGPIYSCDGGNTWQERGILAGGTAFDVGASVDNMVFDRSAEGRIYAVVSSFMSVMLMSGDYGKTWAPLGSANPLRLVSRSLAQDPSGSSLYAADSSRGLIRSQDGGQTWTTITNNIQIGNMAIADFAVDPADPTIAYAALGEKGVFKSKDGGLTWEASIGRLPFVNREFHADKVLVHPLARNVVLTGGVRGSSFDAGDIMGLDWAMSADGGATWAPLVDSNGKPFLNAGLAADPLVAGGWLAFPSRLEGPTDVGTPPTFRWPTGAGDHPFGGSLGIFRLQMVPDADRTVVVSLVSADGTTGQTALFSFRALAEGVSPPPFVDTGLLGPANVVYDGSDSTHRLFVSGKALGRDPHLLYRATVSEVWAGLEPHEWEPLVGDGAYPAYQRAFEGMAISQDSFTTLVIDPASGGQTMYTLGTGNTFWQSRDGGRSWQRDTTITRAHVTGIWLSPVDGAVYRTISQPFADTATNFYAGEHVGTIPSWPGALWKDTPTTRLTPDVRVTRGNLRVACAGPPGFPSAVMPGIVFPIGDTVLSCSATDAFGNVGTGSFTVSVRDTTPPALTVPADVTLTGACTSSQTIGTATATDAVSPPVTITNNRPSIFRAGTTVVTYTARDARGNTSTGTQRVTVVLGNDQTCCPSGTTVRRGTSGNDTINGTTGRDCILGLGGNDTISGRGGDDVISGGDGNDVLDGGDGNDLIYGGNGADRLLGGDGHDELLGQAGDDRLEGAAGNDALNGGPNSDVCLGGTGTNTITECSP